MTSPYLRRATTAVLAAVALIAGATLLLGDRFGSVPSHALTQTVRAGAPVAACVAEENMRLITVGRERCQPDELELASGGNDAGRAERVAADGPAVSAFEVVTTKIVVGARQTLGGEAWCPTGKAAVGGGAVPDPEGTAPAGAEERMQLVASAPRLAPGGDGGYGWTATVRNTGSSTLAVVVVATCVTVP